MKKLLVGLAAAAMLASAGCGQSQTTTTTPTSTPVQVSQGDKQVTITGPSGTVQVDQGGNGNQVVVTAPSATVAVSTNATTDIEKTFGVPPYPGATQRMSVQGGDASSSGSVAIMTTSDPLDKVVAFYKDRFPNANATMVNAGVVKNASFVIEGKGKTLALNITEQGGTTTIQIASSESTGGARGDEPSTDDTMAPDSSPEPEGSPE